MKSLDNSVLDWLQAPLHGLCYVCITKVSKPGTEWVQALDDISHSAPCCHSNETCALIANPLNSAQLEGTPSIPTSYIRVRAVQSACDKEQTHRQPWPIYISHRLWLTQNVMSRIIGNGILCNAHCCGLSLKFLSRLWLLHHGWHIQVTSLSCPIPQCHKN